MAVGDNCRQQNNLFERRDKKDKVDVVTLANDLRKGSCATEEPSQEQTVN